MSVAKAELVAGAGTLITCPRCHAHIGTLIKPLYQGYSFGLDIVRFEAGQTPDPRKPQAVCRKCGHDYSQMSASILGGRRTWLHTQHGWLPPLT